MSNDADQLINDKAIDYAQDYANEHSLCLRHKIGAVIVSPEDEVLQFGCNRPISDLSCKDGCYRDKHHIESGVAPQLCYAVHAEMDAISKAARYGIPVDGCTMYVTHKPCSMCARLIINSGILRVCYRHGYDDPFTDEIFKQVPYAKLIQIKK